MSLIIPSSHPVWSTACPDWEERIVSGRSLIPFSPLFPLEAQAALDIFKSLRIVDARGQPTFGEAGRKFVFDLVTSLFGAYDVATGDRLIQYFLLLIAKKNGKSTLAPGIMLTALLRNWRESGEFFIIAPTREVADNSFGPAHDMIRKDEDLSALLHVQDNFRTITHRKTEATLKVIAADTQAVGGKKTIGLLVEELWQFGNRQDAGPMLREAMGGIASRPEGFVLYLTTQSSKPPAGVFAETLDEFRKIRDGKIEDPRSLPILYEYPKRYLDPKTRLYLMPENFFIPNPNLGASVDERYLLDQLTKAQRKSQSEVIDFCAKHLNVQVGGAGLRSDGWAGAAVWDRGVDVTLTLDELLKRSEVVAVGIDGGGLDDLLGIGVIGREKETRRWLAWGHGLISTIGLKRRKANAVDYLKFKRAGELTVFRFLGGGDEEAMSDADLYELVKDLGPVAEPLPPGDEDDKPASLPVLPEVQPADIQFIVDLVLRIRDLGLLAQVGVDAAGIGAIVDALAKVGVTQEEEQLGAIRQGIGLMGAFKTVERKLADRTFIHGESALLTWCVGNAKVVATPTASRIARDEAGFGKIDPLMGIFNAAALMAMNPEPAASIYTAERGLVFVG